MTPSDAADRLTRLSDAVPADAAVVVGPGGDLLWLLGRSMGSFERLTCLVVAPGMRPRLVVPALEAPGWDRADLEGRGVEVVTWRDGDDAHAIVAAGLPRAIRTVFADDYLASRHLLGIVAAAGAEPAAAGAVLSGPRMRKSPAELDALAEVAAAIDRVQRRVGEWLRAGRTEEEVAADIAAAIVAEGHERADFVIVGSGPNGASPHHEASDRVIRPGDAVVVDIGGPAPSGYFSDCTRTFVVAGDADPELARVHEVVRRAQQAGVEAVRPGVSAESVDAAALAVIEEAGYGDRVLSRTGHGIGLEVHEHPYLVRGNTTELEPGMAFSVEPGIYLPGRFGVRIEDIVVVTDDGVRRLNTAPHELVTVG